MPNNPQSSDDATELRHRAEDRLHEEQLAKAPEDVPMNAEGERLLHELQVHQIELEMQNTELHAARGRLEILVEKYTDLYNFAPIGYFTVDDSDRILESNFAGARLLGLDRSEVIRRKLSSFVLPAMKEAYDTFLKALFAGETKLNCEMALGKSDETAIWVDIQGNEAVAAKDSTRFCRLAVSDKMPLKRAEEALSRVEALSRANEKLNKEIERRRVVEEDLRESEKQARQMQEQLRQMSHLILQSQEEERRRISLDLHDEIAQSLVGINVHLATLARDPSVQDTGVLKKITDVQKVVEDSVSQVHQFAMRLRPPILDDLGLISALRSYLKEFTRQTRIPVDITSNSDLRQLDKEPCIILYRVAQEALANVSQHAQASQVGLRLQKGNNTLMMEIHDNGRSFDVMRELEREEDRGLGIIGMRERSEMGGGTFQILSSPGEGTTVSVSLPLHKSRGKGKKRCIDPL